MIPLDDAPAAGGRRAAVREREEAIVASLRSLGPALDGEPDPAFRMVTRARLVAMAAVRTPEPAPAPRSLLSRLVALRPDASAPAWSPVRRRMTAGLAGGALAVTALATLVAVATGASPGDPLYDLKRGTEQTQLALSGSDRGLTLLGFAHTRLTELASMAGSGDTALAVRTLRDMDDETTAGAAALTARAARDRDAAAAGLLATWGADQSAQLAALRPQLPAGAQPAADQTAALLARVTDRGTALATALGCAAGPSLGGTDPLGPVPLACASSTTNAPVQGAGGGVGSSSVPGTTGTQAVPTPATGTSAGTPPVTGTSGAPGGSLPGGTAPGGTAPGGSVPGGSNPGQVVPTVPGLPTTGLPLPTVPRTGTGTVPPAGTSTVPLPGSLLPPGTVTVPPLPGSAPAAGNGGAGTTSSTSTGNTGLPGVSVCVPQVSIGSC